MVDAILTLAIGFQLALAEGADPLVDGTAYRKKVVEMIFNGAVNFTGVTGSISFDANGDTLQQLFGVTSFRTFNGSAFSAYPQNVGFANKKDTSTVNYADIIFPNGMFNASAMYRAQIVPLCSPGFQPFRDLGKADSYAYCSPCQVGYFKYSFGSDLCAICPVGTSCNNINVSRPCILPGYWRDIPLMEENGGDYVNYPVYQCDYASNCIGQ
jgi:hypothetical protein